MSSTSIAFDFHRLFRWGYVKQNVDRTPAEDMVDLKKRIEKEIKPIMRSSIVKKMDLCTEVDNDHFEHLLSLQLYETSFHRRS